MKKIGLSIITLMTIAPLHAMEGDAPEPEPMPIDERARDVIDRMERLRQEHAFKDHQTEHSGDSGESSGRVRVGDRNTPEPHHKGPTPESDTQQDEAISQNLIDQVRQANNTDVRSHWRKFVDWLTRTFTPNTDLSVLSRHDDLNTKNVTEKETLYLKERAHDGSTGKKDNALKELIDAQFDAVRSRLEYEKRVAEGALRGDRGNGDTLANRDRIHRINDLLSRLNTMSDEQKKAIATKPEHTETGAPSTPLILESISNHIHASSRNGGPIHVEDITNPHRSVHESIQERHKAGLRALGF